MDGAIEGAKRRLDNVNQAIANRDSFLPWTLLWERRKSAEREFSLSATLEIIERRRLI